MTQLEIIRQSGDSTQHTIGELMLNGSIVGLTIEPPIVGTGMTAMPEGVYNIALSHDPVLDRLMPYVVGVPGLGAVMLGFEMRTLGEPDDSFVRIASDLASLEAHSGEDYLLFINIMKALRAAHGKAIVLTVRSEATPREETLYEEDLEMDVNDATRS